MDVCVSKRGREGGREREKKARGGVGVRARKSKGKYVRT